VHVVALGDPSAAHAIPTGNDVLRFDGDVVQSRRNEAMLQEIARRTDGLYFPAYLHSLPLGRLLRGYLAEQPAPEPAQGEPSELTPLEAESQHAWFLLGTFALLGMSMLINDGPLPERPPLPSAAAPSAAAPTGAAPVPLALCLLVMPALISAAPLPDVGEMVRQGNDAFRRQDYEAAITLYEQAETHAVDPGLVAFNKGAALFRLERYAEAAAHWQRCLEDGAIAPERKARAAYDLGTALLQKGGESRRLLERAVTAFRQCLDANPDGELRADALHNLELARWLWLKAKASGADEPPDTPEPPDHRAQNRFSGEEPQGRNGLAPGHDNGGDKMGGDDGPFGDQKKLAQGPLLVLPDQEELVPLPPDETRAALDRLAARIAAEARAYRRQATPARPDVKDW
jgi:tetratricopeptide (TPR) repeat protein